MPAGWAVAETSKKRGLVEDIRLQCELGLSVVFEALRWLLRKALLLPAACRPGLAHQTSHLQASIIRSTPAGLTDKSFRAFRGLRCTRC